MDLIDYPFEKDFLEELYGKDIEHFSYYEKSLGFAPPSRSSHRRMIYTCLQIISKNHERRDLNGISKEDLERIRQRLESVSGKRCTGYLRIFATFLHYVTGNEPLMDISSFGTKLNGIDEDSYGRFAFEKELELYVGYTERRNLTPEVLDQRVKQIRICSRILDSKYHVESLDEIDMEMFAWLEKELSRNMSDSNTRKYLRSMSDFVTYYSDHDLMRELTASRRQHVTINPENVYDEMFVDQLNRYEADLRKWRAKEVTIKGKRSAIVQCYRKLRKNKGSFRVEDVMPEDIMLLRDLFEDYKESTVRMYLYTFCGFIEFVTGYNPYPARKLRYNGNQERRQFIFDEEWEQLYRAADIYERLILSLGATMGIRRNEMINLKMEDVGRLKITIHGKGVGKNGKVVNMDKTDLVERDLNNYLEYRRTIVERNGDRSKGYLLINPFKKKLGMPLTERTFCTILDKLVERSGVSFSSHCLRRYFCTTMYDQDTDIDTLRIMMRHSSVETTMRCYLHADPRRKRAAVNAVNRAFSGMLA